MNQDYKIIYSIVPPDSPITKEELYEKRMEFLSGFNRIYDAEVAYRLFGALPLREERMFNESTP